MAVELLSRSNFSFLRGASHPEELIGQAAELGYGALGLCDLDGVYGLAKAYWCAKDLPGIRLLHGAELTLEDGQGGRAGLAMIARDKAGWSLLCRLVTASHADKPKGEAGLGWADFTALAQAHTGRQGLLVLPRGEGLGEAFFEGSLPQAYGQLKDLFGPGLLVPVGRFLDGRDAGRSRAARALARAHGVRAVATGDVHYHLPGRRRLQDAFTCVREGVSLDQAGWRLFPNGERFLKPPQELARLFADWPEALEAAAEAAQGCTFSLAQLRYRYPTKWVPPGHSPQSWLEALTWQGAAGRYAQGVPAEVAAQLAKELALIGRLGFADYFLTIHKVVDYARSRRILCQGRGSAANSAVCFCLGITAVDPRKIGLLFERFLSEERQEPPDIDVDFEHERREEVIQWLYGEFGRDRAAMVAAVIKYRPRSALADLSKALGRPRRTGRGLRRPDLEACGPRLAGLMEEAREAPRHLSIHSGGFVLSDEPLTDLVPVEPGRMEGRTVVQWDKYDLDYVGLMKVDLLGLGMLSALRRCLDSLGRAGLADLPTEDPGTYAMIQRGDTIGAFQIESRAQMNMLGRLKPAGFYDLVIEVAIVRPGPIVGKMVHPYLRRRRGEEAVVYEHPKLEPILGKTLGVPLFQEQVMRLSVELAGFTPGQADELRRAIGAWRSDGRLPAITGRLRQGLKASGLSDAFCDRLLDEIKGFAEYGFPEAHAASFALLVYASCYLKRHHPAQFTCALLNSQPLGFYASHSLVDDAKRHGVRVLPPDPARSGWDCRVLSGPGREAGALLLGWRVVRGLGQEAALVLERAREERPFEGLDDFVWRSGLRIAVLQGLALADAFEGFGLDQRQALWRVLLLEAFRAAAAPCGQLDLFAAGPALSQAPHAPDSDRVATGSHDRLSVANNAVLAAGPEPGLPALGPWEALLKDYRAYGLSTRAHPMELLRPLLPGLPPCRTAQARRARHGQRWRQAGLCIVRQHPGTAKGVVFATLEDETGLLDLVLHPRVYARFEALLAGHRLFCASGILQRDGDSASLLLKGLQALHPGAELATPSHDWH